MSWQPSIVEWIFEVKSLQDNIKLCFNVNLRKIKGKLQQQQVKEYGDYNNKAQ